MNWLIAHFLTVRPIRPVFAADVDAKRAMRIAEIKWLLAEISAPAEEGAPWQALILPSAFGIIGPILAMLWLLSH